MIPNARRTRSWENPVCQQYSLVIEDIKAVVTVRWKWLEGSKARTKIWIMTTMRVSTLWKFYWFIICVLFCTWRFTSMYRLPEMTCHEGKIACYYNNWKIIVNIGQKVQFVPLHASTLLLSSSHCFVSKPTSTYSPFSYKMHILERSDKQVSSEVKGACYQAWRPKCYPPESPW